MLDDPKYDKPDMSDKCVDFLHYLIKEYNVKTMKEFGSGASTIMFSKIVDTIVSIEHNRDFYKRLENRILKSVIGNILAYHITTTYPVTTNVYDFIYIDGIKRIECMKLAVGRTPLIAIHYSERKEYQEGYNYIESFNYKDISRSDINLKVYYYENFNSIT